MPCYRGDGFLLKVKLDFGRKVIPFDFKNGTQSTPILPVRVHCKKINFLGFRPAGSRSGIARFGRPSTMNLPVSGRPNNSPKHPL